METELARALERAPVARQERKREGNGCSGRNVLWLRPRDRERELKKCGTTGRLARLGATCNSRAPATVFSLLLPFIVNVSPVCMCVDTAVRKTFKILSDSNTYI